MKIFVGWPYEAEWVNKYVLPLIESYGVVPLTGQELQGQDISEGVKDNIKRADMALFITTRRGDPDENGLYRTSDWVVDEIKHANSINKKVIFEVREEGVHYTNKIHDERQYTTFHPEDRIKALVEIGKVIGRLRGLSLKLKLLLSGPADAKFAFAEAIKRLKASEYECSYFIRERDEITYQKDSVEIIPQGQEQFIYTSELPTKFFDSQNAYLYVEVKISGMRWRGLGVSFNTLEVLLESLDSQQFSTQKREV